MVKSKKEKSKKGVGLKITKERLAKLYENNQSLELNKSSFGGLQVSVRIPFQEVSSP
ncbi:MAG: hypothetical protein Q8L04_15260 [Ignavibacteria bacterium]|nr:hypothetical protein [Ignavibacteria bacterium]